MEGFVSSLDVLPLDVNLHKLAPSFHCGNVYIDRFLRESTALDDGFGKTYVWVNENKSCILGFYNISVGCIDEIENSTRYRLGGSVHINEFAIDERYRGLYLADNIRYSDALLQDCIARAKYIRDNYVGFSFITLQSTKEGHSLYKRNEFEDLEEDMSVTKGEKENKCQAMYYVFDLE